jgi:hypothetical protein
VGRYGLCHTPVGSALVSGSGEEPEGAQTALLAEADRVSILGEEDRYLTDSREALRTMIRDIKAGKADHLL